MANAMSHEQLESDLSTLENKYLMHTFSKDTDGQRLDRLDKLTFGRIRHGTDEERVTRLLVLLGTSNATTAQKDAASHSHSSKSSSHAEQPVADKSSDPNTPDPGQSVDNYPTVTALEEKVLSGKTNKDLPIRKRLAKLETVAFGKPSDSEDLSTRVDKLKEYVRTKYGSNDDYLSSSNAVKLKNGSPGLDTEISSMEQQVFGKTYQRDNMPSRVTRLEKKVLPHQRSQTFTPMNLRVSKLEEALNPTHVGQPGATPTTASAPATQPGAPAYSAPSYTPSYTPSYSAPAYGGAPAYAPNPGSTVLATQPNGSAAPQGHPLLRRLGAVAGALGGMAERGLMNSGYGGYGNYGGYGYGNYGNYGNYGYGGFGNGRLPFGL
jgi:hypothetical protein